jgi:hypothetical protein
MRAASWGGVCTVVVVGGMCRGLSTLMRWQARGLAGLGWLQKQLGTAPGEESTGSMSSHKLEPEFSASRWGVHSNRQANPLPVGQSRPSLASQGSSG